MTILAPKSANLQHGCCIERASRFYIDWTYGYHTTTRPGQPYVYVNQDARLNLISHQLTDLSVFIYACHLRHNFQLLLCQSFRSRSFLKVPISLQGSFRPELKLNTLQASNTRSCHINMQPPWLCLRCNFNISSPHQYINRCL